MPEGLKYLVVGAGFTGAVIAERIASVRNEKVLLIDRRSVTGGASHSALDPDTGIECHRHGSHIFHTSSREVWDYIRRFSEFTDYRHKVLIRSRGKVYSMPINLKTLGDFHGRALSPAEASGLLGQTAAGAAAAPRNLEEKAIAQIGRELYETLIAGYTQKQWGRPPRELPAEIINRLPVRTDYNADYFSDTWQGVPRDGYFSLFEKLLGHPNIELCLNTDFREIRSEIPAGCRIVYTGMIDEYFDCRLGALEWRSLRFEWETLSLRDFQGTTVMNYGDVEVPYTRIHEFKHYHPERRTVYESERTVVCREYPREYRPGMEAYYPVADERNRKLLAEYEALAERHPEVIFCGRLGSYRYWDMDKAVLAALQCFEQKLNP